MTLPSDSVDLRCSTVGYPCEHVEVGISKVEQRKKYIRIKIDRQSNPGENRRP